MDGTKIAVEDGKYTFVFGPDDYRVHVLRFGEPWMVIERGGKAVLALMHRVEELEELRKTAGVPERTEKQ